MTGSVVGLVPAADRVLDAHLLAAVDGALSGTGHRARRITTHVDRAGPVAVTAVALDLLPADPPPAVFNALSVALGSERSWQEGHDTAMVWQHGGLPAKIETGARGATPARTAVDQASARSGGRCVRFLGQEDVTGDHPVGHLLAVTEIDEVVGVGRAVTADDVVATAGFLRPQLLDGRVVLLVEPAAGGRWRPVEVESPHRCCGGAHG